MIGVSKMVLSGDERIDGILSGYPKWDGATLTFSIATDASVWNYSNWDEWHLSDRYAVANAVQAANFRTAFATWASYTAMEFVEVADNASSSGDIRIAFTLDEKRPTSSFAYYPGTGVGGDVWLGNAERFSGDAYAVGSGYYSALMHEIGHALGLKHPFEGTPVNPTVLDMEHRVSMHSVMAYEDIAGNPNAGTIGFATTPMVYDILAIQYLYGKNTSYQAGDTSYGFSDQKVYYETIYDAGGNNEFVYSGTKNARIDLNQGQGSYIGQENWMYDFTTWEKIKQIPNVWIAYDTVIQNATTGSGNDTLIGNAADNILSGGAGFDTVVYAGKMDSYNITREGGVIHVSSAADGNDALIDIERVTFGDVAVAYDVSGREGQAYRIYQAAFDRAPDQGGLGFWINAMEHGMTLNTVANAFIGSDEFVSKYGAAASNSDIVTMMYANVLHRAPDAQGLAHWMKLLDTQTLTLADVLTSFSESPENRVALAGIMEQGIVYDLYG